MSLEIIETGTYRKDMGRGHYYVLDGNRIPGITTLISKGWPKNLAKWGSEATANKAIDSWSRLAKLPVSQRLKELLDAPWETVDRAAMRGTQVHVIAEKLLRGEAVSVPADVAGYVQSCRTFLHDWDVRVVFAERPVFNRSSKPQYGGTFDLIADMADGQRRLLDYKTVKEGKSAGWGDHALQGAAYRHAEFLLDDQGNEIPMPEVDGFAVVELSPSGYQVIPMDTSKSVFRQFLAVAHVAGAVEDAPGYVGNPLSPPVKLGAA